MKSSVFVVYDDKNRVVNMYANHTWAHKKAEANDNYHVEEYVHTKNRRAVEMAEFMSRNEKEPIFGSLLL